MATHPGARYAGPIWLACGVALYVGVRVSRGEGLLERVEAADEHPVPSRAQYRRILVPMKLGIIGEEMVATAVKLASEHDAEVHALHVIRVPLEQPIDAPMIDEEERAEASLGRALPLDEGARHALKAMADGDGRFLLNLAEELAALPAGTMFDTAGLAAAVQRRAPLYDKAQESHYNLISALHKSVRGSDVDAALYWLARMLAGGEDPIYIARRLVRMAVEDIGLADPAALPQAIAAWEAYDRLGSPEGELALAQTVIYLATAPKSNAAYVAFGKARRAAAESGSLMPPMHSVSAPTPLMRDLGYGAGYIYDPDTPEGFSGLNYFPDELPRQTFYRPIERGFEREIAKRLEYWEKLRSRQTE